MVTKTLRNLLRPSRVAHAHCDLPCGVYDPAQARIEAESVKACQEKYQGSDDAIFQDRAVAIKEQRATFSPGPETEKLRPAADAGLPRVWLAGDWTRTGWPATMEGAVRSGYLAAG